MWETGTPSLTTDAIMKLLVTGTSGPAVQDYGRMTISFSMSTALFVYPYNGCFQLGIHSCIQQLQSLPHDVLDHQNLWKPRKS